MLKEHPKGLILLFFVEMWERFSYYGMKALLVLYMVKVLLFSTEKAGNIYGLYTGLVYFTPIIGGYLADRFLGQRKCITYGAIFMTLGLLGLFGCGNELFYLSLILMIIANGFFKSNISSIVGLLYKNDSDKKDSGFTIFYMGINFGAFLSPLVCGTVAMHYGFRCGFLTAGIGMVIGFLCYKIFENKLLGDVGLYPVKPEKVEKTSQILTDVEKEKLKSLFILLFFTITFWTCFEQAGSSLTLFAEYEINRNFFDFVIPTGYFQSLNPLYIIVFAPIMSILWGNLRAKLKEPTSVEKFAIALILMFVSYVILTIAGKIAVHGLISPMWLVVAYFVMTIAELCLSPIGLSLVSKLAPRRFLSLIMGSWFLTSFIGNMLSGFWGGKYGVIPTSTLFLTLAVISFISALVLVFLIPYLNKTLKD